MKICMGEIKKQYFKKHFLASEVSCFSSGFTLIEILVVFSVVSILAGIGIASFASYSRTQEVNQAANNLKVFIGHAKFNALSAVKYSTDEQGIKVDCGTATLSGYSVTKVGNNILDLNQVCADSTTNRIKRFTLPSNVTFGLSTTCSEIFFNTLSASPGGVPCTIVLSGNNLTNTISVDNIGNVSLGN